MEIKQHLWWPTPVWEVKTGFDATFNESLLKEITGRNWAVNGGGQANIWHNIEQDSTLPFLNILKKEMFSIIYKCVNEYLPRSYYGDIKLTRGWVNHHQTGKMLRVHYHGDSPVAATYYVKTPKDCGNLLLIDPLGGAINGIEVDEGISGAKFKMIVPEEGKLVFFPGHLLHMVEENKSSDPRVSITTNTMFAGSAFI